MRDLCKILKNFGVRVILKEKSGGVKVIHSE